ncbi:MAG: hypothetical protein MUO64_01055 [Anaerolineales bacterium]|nr:hypothetical protein [Anaerolineales bacterium]
MSPQPILPLLFCFPFSGGYIASAQPVARLHQMPAMWPSGSYHDRTFIGEQTMAFQDAPRIVGQLCARKIFLLKDIFYFILAVNSQQPDFIIMSFEVVNHSHTAAFIFS